MERSCSIEKIKINQLRSHVLVAIIASLLIITPVPALANYTFWTGAVSNNWNDPANWSNGLPGILDTAAVVTGVPFADPVVNTPVGTGYLVRIGDAVAGGPDRLVGNLTIDGNGVLTLTRYIAVGYSDNAIGSLNITGPSAALTVNAINGLGYFYVALGNNSHGTVTISDGAAVNAYGVLDIAAGAGSTGIVTVDASTFSIGQNFFVGDAGSGVLDILNGSMVSSGYLHTASTPGPVTGFLTPTDAIGAGTGSNGVITVSGEGSTLTSYNPLVVGGQSAEIIPFYMQNYGLDAISFF